MLTYDLTKRGGLSKTTFLYKSIRQDICKGRLLKNSRLPSKRELAQHLQISISTVENAYKILESEGYLSARDRSGFYVADFDFSKINKEKNQEGFLIDYLQEEPDEMSLTWYFDGSEPLGGMSKVIRKVLSQKKDIFRRTSASEGCAVLRNAIADFLYRFRGIRARPQNVIIGSGAEYLYRICAQLLDRELTAGIEDPCYEKIEKIYKSLGVKTEYLKMGEDGISSLALKHAQTDFIHVTPYHSHPSGITASLKKRYEYLKWAEDNQGYIIEDDFDSEINYFYKPIDTLYQIDKRERVIYINTFSKSLSPGFRVAYMVLPDHLLAEYRKNLDFYSCTVSVFIQYVLAEYISCGMFERHLACLRRKARQS